MCGADVTKIKEEMMSNEIALFETKDKSIILPVQVTDDTVWLNRIQIAELFNRDAKTIGKLIANALKEKVDNSVGAYFATTVTDDKTYCFSSRKSKILTCLIPSSLIGSSSIDKMNLG